MNRTGPAPPATRPSQLLSKSDFKVASSCPTKLYYRKLGYPDARSGDAYLAMLAEGGYMVEKLARIVHPDGVAVDLSRGQLAAAAETARLLAANDSITLFEATFIHAGRLARVDVLRREGNVFYLMEVKAKSIDPLAAVEIQAATGGFFRTRRRPHAIASGWREYLEDVAFQYVLLTDMHPEAEIRPQLVLVNRHHVSSVDGLPQCFRLVRRSDGRLLDVEFTGDVEAVRARPLTIAFDVSSEVLELAPAVRARSDAFLASLAPVSTRLDPVLGRHCRDCEFAARDDAGRSGFHECWGARAAKPPLVLELYRGGKLIDELIGEGVYSLHDVEPARVPATGRYGQRARRQVEQVRTGEEWIGDELGGKLRELEDPLHFVDFEAARFAIPHFAGMRPYGLLAFQWSCHTVAAAGSVPVHREWLNTDDLWPNAGFAASLRAALGDVGTILVWSHFEATVMRSIADDLRLRGGDPALIAWLETAARPAGGANGGRLLDLHRLCEDHYQHPLMGGRTSIKFVLDAVWRTSAAVRARFEEIEGRPGDPLHGPYAALPPFDVGGRSEVVADGTNAVRAYEAMMYGLERDDAAIRKAWRELLLQYCRLDTLAMVLILEHWLGPNE
jgi:hypothetical protein